MTSLALNPQPSTLNPPSIESLRARYLDHFQYDSLVAALDLMATEDLNDPAYGVEFRRRAGEAAGWIRRNLARTAPQLPDQVYAKFLGYPWERFAERDEVKNPARVVTPVETEVYRRRQRNLDISKAIIAHAAAGTDALKPGDRSPVLTAPSSAPRQATRGPAPLALPGPVLGSREPSELAEYSELITFLCHRCGRALRPRAVSTFDASGVMCVACSLKHTEDRIGQ